MTRVLLVDDDVELADMLREFRFNVFDGYDLDKRQFEDLLRRADAGGARAVVGMLLIPYR